MKKNHFCFSTVGITDLQLWSKSKRRNSVDEYAECTPHKMAKFIKEPIFVTLASESPARHYDTEDSTYDSFHARETGKRADIRLRALILRLHFCSSV